LRSVEKELRKPKNKFIENCGEEPRKIEKQVNIGKH
jgi:hypothetical protein